LALFLFVPQIDLGAARRGIGLSAEAQRAGLAAIRQNAG
jgi:hypothetical protein